MTDHSIYVAGRNLSVVLGLMLLSGCIHWPDAPYLDTAATLSDDAHRVVQRDHPNATLLTPVYRTHSEQPSGYCVTSQVFVFQVGEKTYRGEIEQDGSLSIQPAVLVEALPVAKEQRFFKGASAVAPGGKVSGKIWEFATSYDSGEPMDVIHEFEFASQGRRGLGQIGTRLMSAVTTKTAK